MPSANIKTWVEALRLRTLALSFALIIVGSALAWQHGVFNFHIFALALLTTLFLQILSNLSNDYGDSVSGADNDERVGPARAVQSGAISLALMKKAMWLFAILSLVSGVLLLAAGFNSLGARGVMMMFAVGLLSIVAAITYTVGRHPYGYVGLGDLGVFLFFGLVGVCGSYTLYAGTPAPQVFLPAAAVGLLSVGVLNMNNLRDCEGDTHSGKRTLVVIFGREWAKRYQVFLIAGGLLLMALYVAFFGRPLQWLALLVAPLFLRHLHTVLTTNDNSQIDAQLKAVSVTTLLMSLLFAAGTIISTLS